jgi:hypothetical protein
VSLEDAGANAAAAGSPVGLAFEVPGKLRLTKRLGICTAVDGESARLHLSPKEKDTITVPAASLTSPSAAVPAGYSPATRLLYAARQPNGPIKANWDGNTLLARAGELAGASMAAMRAVADEAIGLGWTDIVAWAPLTETEKAWRQAHHAATTGDLDRLASELERLPDAGYPERVRLLLPHLPAVAGHDRCRALLASWQDLGVPGAATAHRLVGADWDDALRAGAEHLATAGKTALSDRWSAARTALDAAAPTAPGRQDCPAWTAAALVADGRRGVNVDRDLPALAAVAAITPSILDDLVDAGALTPELALAGVETPHRAYLLARLRPHELDDAGAAVVGHHAELARRYCRRRDRTNLRQLPDSPGVAHFQALLDVIEGGAPDAARLHADTVDLLALAGRALDALRAKATNNLPPPVVRDPTLWTMFAAHAQSGQLSPDADTRAAAPDLAQWCDLQRLVGLLWDERWSDAVLLGEKLTSGLDRERQEDEALNLTAYALARLDRGDEAIALLERAMAGSYTEALLVNLSVVASRAKPDVAAAHFARIVNEAPTRDLQIAALRRAVEVWQTASSAPTFPPDLVRPLEVVLSGPCTIEDYATFTSLAATVAPEAMLRLPDPGDERSPIRRIQRARARLSQDDDFGMKDLATEFIAVFRQVGRPPWFSTEWDDLMTSVGTSVFVPFGEAPGSAVFIDTVFGDAPELLTQHQRFVLLPQAGAHLAALFAKTEDALSAEAMRKFFYRPIEEFLAERSKLDPGAVELVAQNFHKTLCIAGLHYLGAMQDTLAEPYNALVQRLRWDSQNRFSILNQMRSILGKAAEHQEEGDRVLDRLRRLGVDTEEGRDRTSTFAEVLTKWRNETIRLRANL